MRKSVIIIFLMLAFYTFAKDGINYQAIIRTTDGKVVASKTISVQMSLINDIQSQNIIYQEIHTTTTNDLGLINLKIGQGESIIGDFDKIDWSFDSFFMQVAVDFEGATNFEIIGTTQLLSVPYALYAKKSGELNLTNLSDDFIKDLAEKLDLNTNSNIIDSKVKNTDYSPIAETKDIVVYQSKSLFNIEAVLESIAIKKVSHNQFTISENGIDGDFNTSVSLNASNFPGLLSGSVLLKILLLPWERNSTNPVPSRGWRCVVITNYGQIFHNFPNRISTSTLPDGVQLEGDINKWDESVVWDLPSHRLPSKTSDVFPYSINPCLPEIAYEIYPAIKNDNGYGNGGFDLTYTPKSNIKFPRFYFHNRKNDSNNPFFFMGGFETTNKIQLIGTYRSNTSTTTSARICIFATTDGGRQWFNKFEFACDQPLAYGNALIGKKISDDYISNSLYLQKRDFIFPSAELKEPTENFTYANKIIIEDINKSDSLIVTTSLPHGLNSGDLIVINKNDVANSSGFDFLCNNNINTKNGGNGKVWKISVINSTSVKLYEYVHNADINIPARHIHGINRVKDGFIITTGEIYPQGWIYYLQIKASDSFTVVNGYDTFNFMRLNSSRNSLQRSLGTILLDDADQTIIFASDEAYIPNTKQTIEGRSKLAFTRSSTGVYKGKLADIDDFSKFTCIYEAEQVAYHFKEIDGMWIFCGQQGELAISVDKGLTWRKFYISGINYVSASNTLAQQFPKGIDNLKRYFLDQIIIYRK